MESPNNISSLNGQPYNYKHYYSVNPYPPTDTRNNLLNCLKRLFVVFLNNGAATPNFF